MDSLQLLTVFSVQPPVESVTLALAFLLCRPIHNCVEHQGRVKLKRSLTGYRYQWGADDVILV